MALLIPEGTGELEFALEVQDKAEGGVFVVREFAAVGRGEEGTGTTPPPSIG